MACLDATFTLTPQSPAYWGSPCWARVDCYGGDIISFVPRDFSSLYAANEFYFGPWFASDPNLDYSKWPNRRHVRALGLTVFPNSVPPNSQLALIFGFAVEDATANARVQVYSDAALLADQTLVYGDSQFLITVDSIEQAFELYFIHAGGSWFFKGISGYVV